MDYLLELAPLINKNMYPLTWQHAVGFIVVSVIGYYVVNALFRIPVVRWTYMGVLVIFIANLFWGKNKNCINIFAFLMD